MKNQLEVIVKSSGLETTKAQTILDKFSDYFKMAAEWEERAKGIVVTKADQKVDMQIARTGRLFLRDRRLDIEKARKEMKEQSLREGKAIDGISNVLKALIVPIEEYLGKQENFVKIIEQEAAEKERIEEESRLEAERIAKEKADQEEQERIRVDNERLRKEADEKEAQLIKERKAAEKKQQATEYAARKKQIALEDKARKEREVADEVLAKERAERQAIEDKARLAKEAADRKAREVKEKADAERQALEDKLARQIECPECHALFIPGDK